jgi:hypothetical protein
VLINNLLSERSRNLTDAEEDPHWNLQHLNCVEEQNQDFICMPAGSIALVERSRLAQGILTSQPLIFFEYRHS